MATTTDIAAEEFATITAERTAHGLVYWLAVTGRPPVRYTPEAAGNTIAAWASSGLLLGYSELQTLQDARHDIGNPQTIYAAR
jgi:hypothetical protein